MCAQLLGLLLVALRRRQRLLQLVACLVACTLCRLQRLAALLQLLGVLGGALLRSLQLGAIIVQLLAGGLHSGLLAAQRLLLSLERLCAFVVRSLPLEHRLLALLEGATLAIHLFALHGELGLCLFDLASLLLQALLSLAQSRLLCGAVLLTLLYTLTFSCQCTLFRFEGHLLTGTCFTCLFKSLTFTLNKHQFSIDFVLAFDGLALLLVDQSTLLLERLSLDL
mmetsp:Transcript_2645/g.8310  ORF Transcript_2645/g.8310 Transcript_2645/m.8310 type:complete len:224 (-) Transcript_2645:2245-2916(-)